MYEAGRSPGAGYWSGVYAGASCGAVGEWEEGELGAGRQQYQGESHQLEKGTKSRELSGPDCGAAWGASESEKGRVGACEG